LLLLICCYCCCFWPFLKSKKCYFQPFEAAANLLHLVDFWESKNYQISAFSRLLLLLSFGGFNPILHFVFGLLRVMLLLLAATDPLVLLGFQPNDISFPFNWFKGESTRRGKCKMRSPIGLKRESSCQEKEGKRLTTTFGWYQLELKTNNVMWAQNSNWHVYHG